MINGAQLMLKNADEGAALKCFPPKPPPKTAPNF